MSAAFVPERPDDDVAAIQELVEPAVHGDAAARAALLALIRPRVLRLCRSKLGPAQSGSPSADDVTQDVCLGVLLALPSYRLADRPFWSFVVGIAKHKIADAVRAKCRNRAEPVADLPEVVAAAAGPEQQALARELAERLDRALSQLPDRQRRVLELRLRWQLSAEETAAIVGSTPTSVRVTQHRVLKRLRPSFPTDAP